MGQVKEINIKNQTYFFDDMVNIKHFHVNVNVTMLMLINMVLNAEHR